LFWSCPNYRWMSCASLMSPRNPGRNQVSWSEVDEEDALGGLDEVEG